MAEKLDPNPGSPPSVATTLISFQCPAFWVSNPKAWFLTLECQFQSRNIKSSLAKYNFVVPALPLNIVEEVMDILTSPPDDHPYEALRDAILQRTGASEKERLRRLLQDLTLGEKKPSQLLRHMQQEIGQVPIDDALLRELWFQKLPSDVQFLLAPSQGLDVQQVALMADNAMQYRAQPVASVSHTPAPTSESPALQAILAELAELRLSVASIKADRDRSRGRRSRRSHGPHPRAPSRTRSASRPSSPSSRRPLCWYHHKYGKDANNCEKGCQWDSSKGGNARANE